MQRKNNYCECFGLPGSGKTTLIKELSSEKTNNYNVQKISRWKRLLYTLFFIVRYPKISWFFIYNIFKNESLLYSYLLHLVSMSFAQYVFLKKNTIIDEGVFQRVLSIYPKEMSYSEAQKIINLLSKMRGKILIFEGGDFSRFYEKGGVESMRTRLGAEYFEAWKKRVTHNFDMMCKILLDQKNDDNVFLGNFKNTDHSVLLKKVSIQLSPRMGKHDLCGFHDDAEI
jgi:Cdc6-like AAA superfamily ATPase